MKTLTADEYDCLKKRCDMAVYGTCSNKCIRVNKTHVVLYTSTDVLAALIQRGLLDTFVCQTTGATHYYTNTQGKVAMTLYVLVSQLDDLKLQNG